MKTNITKNTHDYKVLDMIDMTFLFDTIPSEIKKMLTNGQINGILKDNPYRHEFEIEQFLDHPRFPLLLDRKINQRKNTMNLLRSLRNLTDGF